MIRLFIIIFAIFCLSSCGSESQNSSIDKHTTHPRIITLAPHLAELVVSAGALDHLVGVTQYSDFPDEVKQIPRIGDAFSIDFESILKLKPDLVLIWKGGTSRSIINRLHKYKIKTITIEINNLKDIPKSVVEISNLTKTNQIALQNINEFNTKINNYKNNLRISKSAFIQLSEKPLFTVSSKHWMTEAISLCGLNNIFSDLKPLSAPVNIENVLEKKPEYILNVSNDESDLWNEFKNPQSRFQAKIINIDPKLISIPSMRILYGVDMICSQIESLIP